MYKIATIYTLYGRRAGAELYFEKFIEGLDSNYNKDFEFTIYCNKEAEELLKNYHFKNTKLVYLSILNNQILKALWLEFFSGKEIDKSNFNCFWIPSGTNHFPGKWNIKKVVTFHDFGEYYVKNKYDFIRTIYRKHICIKRSIKRGSKFCCVSETTAKDLMSFWKKESHVVYSGPSPQLHHANISSGKTLSSIIKKDYNINIYKSFILHVGRTDFFGKGLDILLSEFKRIKDDLPEPTQLILCGPEGENHHLLINNIKSKFNGEVLYLGRVETGLLEALYRATKAVVFPSRYEGFGFPILEAYYYKRPVIISNGGALPEIAGGGALIFDLKTPTELGDSIKYILSNDDEARKLIKKSQMQLHKFSWDISLKKMRDVFLSEE